jgi:hypothetical protein
MSGHLAPFALRAAFPPSSAGRDSGDYYGASVALGLAPGRRSHVRRCRTWQRDLGVPFVSFNALTGHRSWPRKLPGYFTHTEQGRRRFRVSFRRM